VDDATELAAFVVAAEELHLGRAGERLGVGPRAVAGRLRALERRLDLVLLDRSHRCRIALTQAGVAVLPAARRVLRELHGFEDLVGEVRRGERGVVRVALTSDGDAGTGRVIDALGAAVPGWEVVVERMDVRAAGRAMAIGGIECSVGRGHPAPRTGPGIRDPRPNRLERTRVLRIPSTHEAADGVAGSAGRESDRLVVAWRAGWEDGPGPAGASDGRAGLLRRWRHAAGGRRAELRAARRRAVEARQRAAAKESELRARETARFGVTVAAARAAARERADVFRRVAEARAKGESISPQLAIAWLCARRADDDVGAAPP
jgi:DNA-binding transcriptional LysR family regulator